MPKLPKYERRIDNKVFVLYHTYPTETGAKRVANKINNETPEGFLAKAIGKSVWVYDGIKRPWDK
jgi:hypothetical protein